MGISQIRNNSSEQAGSSDRFIPFVPFNIESNEIAANRLTHWQDALHRFKQNKPAMLGLITVTLIIISAIIGPFLTPHSYSDQFLDKQGLGPCKEFWFGTDNLGRDIFVRVLYGARISLSVGLVASFINLTVGVIYGGIAGLAGGRLDNIMMRIVDVFYSIPLVLYVILLIVILGPGLKSIFIALGLVYWMEMARIVRAQVLSLKEQEFVLAARTLGASRIRILFRHLIPNCTGPIIITASMNIPMAIFTEAYLSFLGLGVALPMASWGVLVYDAMSAIRSYPHMLFFPALIISITMLAFNFLGDGIRDALDPRFK